MLIDVNAYVGHWPFRKLYDNTLEGLDAIAKKNDITHMCVSSINGIFYRNAMDANEELAEQLKEYKGDTKILPFAIINPTFPAWREDMERGVKELGFKGIELCPLYHGVFGPYKLAKEGAEVFKFAGELGVPVRICAEFENVRQHHRLDISERPSCGDIVAMLKASEKTTLILNGFITEDFTQPLVDMFKTRKNIFTDISRVEAFTYKTWKFSVENLGKDHMCFGTLSPFYYAETPVVRMNFADLTESEIENIAWKNIKDYIQL